MRPSQPGEPAHVGRYRVLTTLGEGGMGRVLLGLSPDGRLAAVKQIRPALAGDPAFRARFRREVETSRMVSGAYTAAVLDADPDAPAPWLASVFVAGPTLRDAGPLPPESVRFLAAGLASALGEIHRAGLVHRDLKPGNVILADDGPRVIDFGVARAATGASELTHTGSIVGSPGFMSPEQAEGKPLTPASDVFSLGSLLVMASTGQSPFAGASAPQTLYNIVHNPPDLRAVPPPVAELAARCLAKDPARRPTPAQILEHLGPVTPGPRPWPPAVHAAVAEQRAAVAAVLDPPRRRGPIVAVAAAVVVVLAVVLGITLTGDEPATQNVAASSTPPPPPPPAATPPNQDPLAAANLRRTDPCKVLDGRTVGKAGVLKADSTSRFTACTYTLADGRSADLTTGGPLGKTTSALPPTQIEGRPLVVLDSDTGNSCRAAVQVVDAPGQGIVAEAHLGAGGPDSCETAQAMLAEALRRIRAGEAVRDMPGSLRNADPCALPDPATAIRLFGTPRSSGPSGSLYWCTWEYASTLKVALEAGTDPAKDPGLRQVRIGDLTAYERADDSGLCTVLWAHRPLDETSAELVTLSYGAVPGSTQATICQNLRELAATIVPRLPKP
ncbi:serine/threonine-protein kinase [Amycolatopsis suaedae]|uniref:Serine/threonine protein kinase n=1 Tax=Amycolatopsis suaedae TaxID=2510978 RepID=A0A4Q7J367_9PSEU|nr:serine/threonine-protein kinase [Amycolatopsis suaedae]RZQ61931.1 serine/threonine protein kinase [Amycolatopsis suaedae]